MKDRISNEGKLKSTAIPLYTSVLSKSLRNFWENVDISMDYIGEDSEEKNIYELSCNLLSDL